MKKAIYFNLIVLGFISTISFSQEALVGFNVDVLPTNIGGKAEFKRIFDQELIYPANSLKKKIGGKITFKFNIMKDSSVTDIIAADSIAPDINAEAIRLFKLYQWVPAVKGGQFINTKWSATFDFNPDKYDKICNLRGFKSFKYLQDSKLDSSGTVYKIPEQFPMYQKGNYALHDFIKENLEYPRQAQLSNIQGTVILQFVVEPSGLVTNIGVDKSVGGGCDQEAIRVLQLIKWYPGKNENKFARIQMTFPFYFILNEEFKDNSNGEQK